MGPPTATLPSVGPAHSGPTLGRQSRRPEFRDKPVQVCWILVGLAHFEPANGKGRVRYDQPISDLAGLGEPIIIRKSGDEDEAGRHPPPD